MKIKLNNQTVHFNVEGARAFGADTVLLQNHDDLTDATHWKDQGFVVAPLLEETLFQQFQKGMENQLRHFLHATHLTDDPNFPLTQYHHLVHSNYQKHLEVVNKAKLIENSHFPIDVAVLEERLSEICEVQIRNTNPYNKEKVFHFRIIRPDSNDNNPLHRDVWLEEYHDCINIYVPICGSNPRSSLTLIPGSHWWKESFVQKTIQGARVNGVQFNVPAITEVKKKFQVIRPDPKLNEILVFSPYLIHGGAVNLNPDTTRISLEMRFWRKVT